MSEGMTRKWRPFFAGLMALICARAGVANAQIGRGDRYAGETWATRSPVIAEHGMAATEQPLASEAAIDILKKGGSAVDAAIAANAVIGLMQPVLNGIGGDLFAIVWDPQTHQLYGYNGSGPAAMGRSLEKMRAEISERAQKGTWTNLNHIPPVGSLPITVPGAVDGWFALHDKFGRLSMSKDLAPAIKRMVAAIASGVLHNASKPAFPTASDWARQIASACEWS